MILSHLQSKHARELKALAGKKAALRRYSSELKSDILNASLQGAKRQDFERVFGFAPAWLYRKKRSNLTRKDRQSIKQEFVKILSPTTTKGSQEELRYMTIETKTGLTIRIPL